MSLNTTIKTPFLISSILSSFIVIVFLIICIMLFTLSDRRVIAFVQRRKGPFRFGWFGFFQPICDGLKLILKDKISVIGNSNLFLFKSSPIIFLTLSLTSWAFVPFSYTIIFTNTNLSLWFIFILSSINAYAIIIAGWSSNSKYAFLGCLRSVSQLLAYEIAIMLTTIPVVICSGSLNFIDIILKQEYIFFLFPFSPAAFIFFVSIIAETNRSPFDLAEAESELVAGYNTEYSSMLFALFFLGEYNSMILMSSVWVMLFFGGWLPVFNSLYFLSANLVFFIKIIFICFLFSFIRANLPRYRFDQLLSIGWKLLLPISGLYAYLTAVLILFFNCSIINFLALNCSSSFNFILL